MNDLTPYWNALRSFGIEGPCRVYLAGPFGADEVALRFLLHKLGFILLDRWNAQAAQWVVHGRGGEASPLANGGRRLAPALFGVDGPFHLLHEGTTTIRRRKIFKFLKNENEKNIRLGLSLLLNGGFNTYLLEEVLAALFLHQKDEDKRALFLRHITPFLPDRLVELLRESIDILPFRLGYIRELLHRFSPIRFLQLLAEEHTFPFQSFQPLVGMYAEKANERAEAWRQMRKDNVLNLRPEHLWLLAELPADGPVLKLGGKLRLYAAPQPECLDKLLGRHPAFFSKLKALIMKGTGTTALRIISSRAHQLEILNLEISAPVSIAALLEGLSTTRLRTLVIKSTHHRRAEIGLPSEHYLKATRLAGHIRRLSISNFRNLSLTGIEQFKNLRTLSLSNNRLEALSPEIGELQKLQHLSLFEPTLQNLPDSFYHLPLKKIWLGSNELSVYFRAQLIKAFPPEAFRNSLGLHS